MLRFPRCERGALPTVTCIPRRSSWNRRDSGWETCRRAAERRAAARRLVRSRHAASRIDERVGDVTLVMRGHYTVKDWTPGSRGTCTSATTAARAKTR